MEAEAEVVIFEILLMFSMSLWQKIGLGLKKKKQSLFFL
jgi:hypothetical protein